LPDTAIRAVQPGRYRDNADIIRVRDLWPAEELLSQVSKRIRRDSALLRFKSLWSSRL
jgi:hypothetical protein